MNLLAESTLKFCEYYLNGNEYFNALSAIFFFIIAGIIFYKRKNRRDLYFSIIILLIGIFTIALHYTATILGQILDFSSMYIITLFLFTMNIETEVRYIKKYSLPFFLLIYMICILLSFSSNYVINILIFGISLILTIATLHFHGSKKEIREEKLEFRNIILILAVGYIFWLLDYFRVVCIKDLAFY